MPSRQLLRACVFALLMAGAVVVAWAWRPTQLIADGNPKVDLEMLFPKVISGWVIDPAVIPIQPSPDQQKVIASIYDQTFSKTYRNASGDRIMLSATYGRNQHEESNYHRPEICYPSQGIPIVAGSRIVTTVPFRGRSVKVTRLVAANPSRHEPITYWLIVGDEITTYGRGHKLVTLEYGLRGKIPDGIFVRVSSIDLQDNHAFALQAQFIDQMLNAMTPEARVAVLGKLAA